MEKVQDEIAVIEQALGDLEGAQAAYVRLDVFRRREVVPKAAAEDTEAGAAQGGGDGGAAEKAEEEEEEEEEEVVIIHETVGVTLTLDLYAEKMASMARELRGGLRDARELRDAAVARFAEVAVYFGERPQAVKEHDWWGTVIKFVRLANGVQSAIIKEAEDARAEAERKAKRLRERRGGAGA